MQIACQSEWFLLIIELSLKSSGLSPVVTASEVVEELVFDTFLLVGTDSGTTVVSLIGWASSGVNEPIVTNHYILH